MAERHGLHGRAPPILAAFEPDKTLTASSSRLSSPCRRRCPRRRPIDREPGRGGKDEIHAKLLIISSRIALAGGASAAQADSLGRPCTDKPESQYLSLDALKAKVAEQGYEIRSGEIKLACGEFYVLDKAGKRAELFLDPTTGAIVSGDPGTGTGAPHSGVEKHQKVSDADEGKSGGADDDKDDD